VLSFLCAFAIAARGQDGSTSSEKRASAARVAEDAIRVDGRLDEAAWEQASAVIDFVQKEPTEGARPTERMEVRFVYDASVLYVGARMAKNPGSPIQAPMGRRDRFEQAESLFVALDTFHDRRTAYVFGVTAAGVRLDRFHPEDNEGTFDEGFDPVWQARTSIDAQGWTAELWIPLSQLRFTHAAEQVWGVNIRRFTPTLEEDDYWVPIPRTVTAWSSRFGELRGITDVASSRRVELRPYVAAASTVTASRDAGNPFDRGGNVEPRVGADVKMGVGPNLTLDATINPDFGQVEADPAEVNLSGVETFFDERRFFFTKGAGLLNLAPVGNFFYSRRIGTLKPDLNLDVYAEPFAASGHYTNIGELAAAGTRLRRAHGTDGTTAAAQDDGSLLVTDGGASFAIGNNGFNVRSFRSNVVLRWEYRPGSTIYFVWQQDRRVNEAIGTRMSAGDPFRALAEPGNNYFIVKTSLWLPVHR
jgi:hypothetical protein